MRVPEARGAGASRELVVPSGPCRAAGIDPARPETIPFCLDASGGSENELQSAVAGAADRVDLPRSIRESNYFANAVRRAAAGDTSRRAVTTLEEYLESGAEVWESSWVRLPRRTLNAFAESVFEHDLRADKRSPESPRRADAARFLVRERGEESIRVPISYLLKLALADAIGAWDDPPEAVRAPGVRLLSHFTSDNTSPETCSFHVPRLTPNKGCGRALVRETAKRYLFSQLLIGYANRTFELEDSGQRALLFDSPHPPVRQRRLNDAVSDSFYRELFMSPCLSGWDRGEQKREYMALCHQTLSRSQLNAVGKLREAGIITRNLVVLPNTSNVSLAANGVHVSLGSGRLTQALEAGGETFTDADEKYLGDLAIKVIEHFLPLFVGTYSAAPYRLEFEDFHPEAALGYLPHQLDYTHLRRLWRRWQGKARNRVFGQAMSPFGPVWLDRLLARWLRLKGDFVPDFRLIDYLIAPLSTDRTAAFDGSLGSEGRLVADLDDLGVFDRRMSFYAFCRSRAFHARGYSGFEGRFYSLFGSLASDMRHAVNLQMLVAATAYKLIAAGRVSHAQIPDRPAVESERRQAIFGAAIGLPTFFVDEDSPNSFLLEILKHAERTRPSRRYPGRIRSYTTSYQFALLAFLAAEGRDLAEAMGIESTLDDLRRRLESPEEESAAGKLTRGALEEAGARSAFDLRAEDFNLAAERFYRGPLRRARMEEAFDQLEEDCRRLDRERPSQLAAALERTLGGQGARRFLWQVREDALEDRLPAEQTRRLLSLMLLIEHGESLGLFEPC